MAPAQLGQGEYSLAQTSNMDGCERQRHVEKITAAFPSVKTRVTDYLIKTYHKYSAASLTPSRNCLLYRKFTSLSRMSFLHQHTSPYPQESVRCVGARPNDYQVSLSFVSNHPLIVHIPSFQLRIPQLRQSLLAKHSRCRVVNNQDDDTDLNFDSTFRLDHSPKRMSISSGKR